MNRDQIRQTVLLLRARRWHAAAAAGGMGPRRRVAEPATTELPAVIRPRPVSLADLEVLAGQGDPLLRPFARRPELIESVASFVHARDPVARERFPSRGALLTYLQCLLRCRAAT